MVLTFTVVSKFILRTHPKARQAYTKADKLPNPWEWTFTPFRRFLFVAEDESRVVEEPLVAYTTLPP